MHYFVTDIMWFENIIVYKTPLRRYFCSPWSSDCTGLIVVYLKKSNVYNCNIVCICCSNVYWLFAASN